jgi:cytoskeletal protein CcmA (bactofilin family)
VEPKERVSAVGRTLRYLGLSDGPESEAATQRALRSADGRDGATLGSRLCFRGEVTGEGDFHISGRFEGDISVTGRVMVSEGAEVDANISALSIVIGGTVRGNLSASTRVEILPSGMLTGSLKTGSFTAADGASVKGEVWVEPGTTRTGGVDRKT